MKVDFTTCPAPKGAQGTRYTAAFITWCMDDGLPQTRGTVSTLADACAQQFPGTVNAGSLRAKLGTAKKQRRSPGSASPSKPPRQTALTDEVHRLRGLLRRTIPTEDLRVRVVGFLKTADRDILWQAFEALELNIEDLLPGDA